MSCVQAKAVNALKCFFENALQTSSPETTKKLSGKCPLQSKFLVKLHLKLCSFQKICSSMDTFLRVSSYWFNYRCIPGWLLVEKTKHSGRKRKCQVKEKTLMVCMVNNTTFQSYITLTPPKLKYKPLLIWKNTWWFIFSHDIATTTTFITFNKNKICYNLTHASFPYSLKITENQRFFDVFRGYKNESLA